MPGTQELSEDAVSRYVEAGKIASRVKQYIKPKIKPHISLLELCTSVENEITSQGGIPAFPCNICVNEIAAHYTATPNDNNIVPPGSLVKVDIGVHIEGFIVDTAFTINLSPADRALVAAAEDALRKAISRIGFGSKLEDIGNIVEPEIRSRGFKVVRNLTGHEITRFNLHAGLSVPNVSNSNMRHTINRSVVLALEPFVTYANGAGEVVETQKYTIFKLHKRRKETENLYSRFRSMPFCERWLKTPLDSLLMASGSLYRFPVLVEKFKVPVAQAEETVLVLPDKTIVLT